MNMTTRRQFIEGAIATGVSVAAVTPSIAHALALDTDTGSYLRLERVVFDERFAPARIFAEEARKRFVNTSAINGSIHELWYNDLYYHWRDKKSPTAGITDARSLFLLEMMANDAGMRVVHRVHHAESAGTYDHRVFGPLQRRDELTARMSGVQANWARHAADIVTSWPSATTSTAPQHSNILSAKLQALDARSLVSWIIL
jgi:hypothetical protein